MKPLHLVLALVALIAVLGAALLLYEPDGEGSGDVVTIAPVQAERAPRDGLAAAGQGGAPIESLKAAPAPVVQTTEEVGAMPASYRAALGGLTGRVVEEDGEPVADMPLILLGGGAVAFLPALDTLTRTGELSLDPELGSTRTDDEGRFWFSELDPRILGAVMVDPGGPRTFLHIVEESPVSGAERDLGDIVLPAGVTLIGRVIDERGAPLPDVRVRATDVQAMILGSGVADFRAGGGVYVEDDGITFVVVPPPSLQRLEPLLPFPTTTSDEEGRFELPGVRPGAVSIVLDDNRHLTTVKGPQITGAAGGTLDLGDLRMPDGLTQEGRVFDADGEPVPGAEVMVGNQLIFGPVAVLRPPVRADEKGRFAVTGLSEAVTRAAARASADQAFSGDTGPGQPGVREVIVRLPKQHSLTLDLRDQDGNLVPDAHLMARHLPMAQASEMPDWLLPPSRMGAVTRDEQERYVIGDLDPGHWDVLIAAEGYGVVRRGFDLAGLDLVESITLERARSLVVRSVDEGDEPIEYALVTARFVGEDESSGGSRRRGGMGRRGGGMPVPTTSDRSDGDGEAVLEGLHAGEYALEIVHPAFAVTKIGVTVSDDGITCEQAPIVDEEGRFVLSLPLLRGGTIVGQVLDNGAPPTDVLMVTLNPEDEDAIVNAALPRLTMLRPDGSFRFENVQPGTMELKARQRLAGVSLNNFFEPFMMTPEAEGEVWVEAGRETEVVLEVGSAYADIETGFVSGRLTVNGYPAEGWKVVTWGKIRRSVTTDGDGAFTLGQLAAGTVTLMFNAPGESMFRGGAVDTFQFELPVNGREYQEVALTTGSVEGRVRSGLDGQPLTGAEVRLEATDTKRSGWWGGRGGTTVTDADGRYRFETVAEGEYVVQASADGFARAATDSFEVRSLQTARNIEVTLYQAVTVKGRVVFTETPEQPTWVFLNATSEEGGEANARVDRETGRFSFDDMAPGQTWTFQVWTNLGGEYTSDDHYIAGPEENLELTFSPAPEEVPPQSEDEVTETVEVSGDSKG